MHPEKKIHRVWLWQVLSLPQRIGTSLMTNVQRTARLKEEGLSHFHMVEFAHSKGLFSGWREDEERRQRLYGDLVKIITSNVYRQFAWAIEMGNFDTLSVENKKTYSLNAYVLAARTCGADIRRWQEQENFKVPTAYVFEDGDDGKGMLIQRYEQDALPTPHFKPKTAITKDGKTIPAFTPLQAADVLAYELHKPYRDVILGRPKVEKFRWGFAELSKIPGVPGHYSTQNLEQLNSMLRNLGRNA